MITYKDNDGLPIPTFHCNNCGQDSEGFSICLKCNPQTYEVVGVNIDFESQKQIDEMSKAWSDEVRIWNEAIEATAKWIVEKNGLDTLADFMKRSLKK